MLQNVEKQNIEIKKCFGIIGKETEHIFEY